ncbi:MAG: hypothetical protein ABSA97_13400 [Verrucomicrobiia bacterium]
MRAWLVFPGNTDAGAGEHQLIEPPHLAISDVLLLELRHLERWRRQDVTRAIVGSERSWADFLLVDEPLTIRHEYARFYLNHLAPLSAATFVR